MNRLYLREILLLHHSHLDVGYTHTQPILWELQNEYLDQTLDWLEQTEGLPEAARPKWTCEASEPLLRWVRRSPPAQRARFQRLHREGRIGVSAMRWHTTALANRRGLERLLAGKRELEQWLETAIRVACQHDVTGVSWPLADVLLDAGVDFFVMAINIHLGRAVKPRPGMFLWEAPSGRKLRVWNGNHYTMFDQIFYAWEDSVDRMAEGWAAYAAHLESVDYPYDFFYLTSTCAPVMWDNAPNNPFLPGLVARWNDAGRGPALRYATFDDLRARAAAIPDAALPVMRGDWTDYWLFGSGSCALATARNQQAKALIEAAGVILPPDAERARHLLAEAAGKADLYDEHTYGYYDSDHTHPQAETTELLKQAAAHEGHELAAFAVMDGLERLAQNPTADRGIKGVLLCNPGPQTIAVFPELPAAWFTESDAAPERTYRASRMFYNARSWGVRFPGAGPRRFGRIDLPPRSWKAVPFEDLPPPARDPTVRHILEVERIERRELNFAPAASYERRIGRIETPHHILRYDPDSGRILSMFDQACRRQVLAPRGGMDFFAFVRERTNALIEDRRYAFYQRDLEREKFDLSCWQDWSPVRECAERVLRCTVEANPDRIVLIREFAAAGMIHLTQRITFQGHDPAIILEIEAELVPDPSPQGIYFAVPLDLGEGWQAAFDTAGALVRLDDDQLPGACRNWAAAETMAAVWNDEGGVALFTPDAPNVQFGDFHFGPPLDKLPRPRHPLLLAWPANNYWDTNIPQVQSGRIRLRYGFATFGKFDPEKLRRQAQLFRQPPLVWPVTSRGRGKGEGSLP